MSNWSEGYVSDIAYSIGYYREMAPDHIGFAALTTGKSSGPASQPKRILELGFGMGLAFVIAAASRPETFHEGCDFNPEHVVHVRGLAEEAGLTNVSIREASFQELAAEAHEGQHDLDLIQLHGILTWVSADAHRAIVEIARKRLKPGGILYVSYNCMPGWAPMLPVQRYIREHAKRHGGSSISKTAAAMQDLKALAGSGGRFFLANEGLGPRMDKLASMNASYLAHEYLNENWFIFDFADVVSMMAGAKLSYLTSATIGENIDSIAVPSDMLKQVQEATDPIWKERLTTALNQMHFTLAVPRSDLKLKLNGPLGEVTARSDIYEPIADLLANRIVPFTEVSTLPALAEVGLSGTLQALALLVHTGQVLPVFGGPSEDFTQAQRLNRKLVQAAAHGSAYNFLAAPAVRGGIGVSSIEMLALSPVLAGNEQNVAGVIEFVIRQMTNIGRRPLKDGVAVTDPDAMRQLVTTEVEKLLGEKLPLLRRLGCFT